jgi:hypothetical protein
VCSDAAGAEEARGGPEGAEAEIDPPALSLLTLQPSPSSPSSPHILTLQPSHPHPQVREAEIKARRKLIQAQHEQEYRDSLVTQKQVVYDTEGPDMKEEMMDQLRDWYIKYREREGEVRAAVVT